MLGAGFHQGFRPGEWAVGGALSPDGGGTPWLGPTFAKASTFAKATADKTVGKQRTEGCARQSDELAAIHAEIINLLRASFHAIMQQVRYGNGMKPLPITACAIAVFGLVYTTARVATATQSTATVVTTSDGREIKGTTVTEDTFSVHIRDDRGQIHVFDKVTRTVVVVPAAGISYERLVKAGAEPHNWPMYWGDYQGTHYSALAQITTGNVARLQAAWTLPMPGAAPLQVTPIVIDGVMYVSQPGATAALDARTGREIWRSVRPQKVKNPNEINPSNRGVAVLDRRVFVGTLDGALLALDAASGATLWEIQVGDSMAGYTITSPPLVVKDKVIVGVSGGEFGARGFLDAYDAASGRRVWRWYTVPGPGEFGHDTWPGDSWKQGGSPTWLTGSFDPALNLVYWTVGNPGPQIDRSVRGDLDNLFSDSVVAIDPDTGERKWHYQFTPNDGHDWDSCQDVVLVDRRWRGQMRKLLLHADRNGYFYVLDRVTGQFLAATPFVYANWASGFDAAGRPQIVPGSNSSREGSFFVYPTIGGGTNFQAPSYSPLTGWFYLQYRRRRSAICQRAATLRGGHAVHRTRRERGSGGWTQARRAGPLVGHQGDRSGNRQDDVGRQDLSTLDDHRRARHRRSARVRGTARRQSRRG